MPSLYLAALCCAAGGAAIGPALATGAALVPGVTRDARRTGLVCVLAAVAFGGTALRLLPDRPVRYALPAYLVLAGAGVLLWVVDADVRRLPDAITLPAYPAVLALLVPASLLGSDPVGWAGLGRAVAGGLAAALLFLLLALPRSAPLGFGDVKLAGLLGLALAWLSWAALAVGIVLGFAYGAAYGLVLLAFRRVGLRTRIPFGPAMLAGAFTAILIGEPLLGVYTAL